MTLKNWKDAWFIFITDVRKDRFFLIWNVIFMAYLGFMMGGMFHTSNQAEFMMHPIMDFMMLSLSPMIGLLFTRRSFSYLKEDSYSQMLVYYRSLPIPTEVVMLSRYIQMGAATVFNGVIVYGTMYLLIFNSSYTSVLAFLVYVLTWVGYALMINALYIHFEFLTKGRTYLGLTTLLILCAGIIAIIVAVCSGNIVNYTIQGSAKYGFASPVMWGTLITGIVMIRLLGKITRRKLDQRSFVK